MRGETQLRDGTKWLSPRRASLARRCVVFRYIQQGEIVGMYGVGVMSGKHSHDVDVQEKECR